MTVGPANGSGAAIAAEPTPSRRPRPGRHLRPVEAPSRRRSPAVPVLVGTGIVLVALFGLAVMHALLIGGQIQLDGAQREVASESEAVRRLRLRVAELESPDRVLEVARDRLGMVPTAEVGYLLPVGVETGSDERVRVEPAGSPDAEAEPLVGTVSPKRPVDGDITRVEEETADQEGDAEEQEADADQQEADAEQLDGGTEEQEVDAELDGGPEETAE